ncbi:MAG: hypothetical protein Q7T19_15345 [Caulobacter sp.]|nr:hypothetical protein [Caulobacter sp.]
MTTEIAVINRLGVALATDSAVTISGHHAQKVFDTGDKLFELHETAPIGVMINGNMDLLGVPWELVIKDFRASRPEIKSQSMKDWMQCLLDFVAKHPTRTEGAEERFVLAIAIDEFTHIKRLVQGVIFGSPNTKFDVAEVVEQEAEKRRKSYADVGVAESLASVSRDAVRKKYAPLLNKVITEQFAPVVVSTKLRMILRKVVVDGLFTSVPSPMSTGIIVAGYGDGDMFPSIAIAEVEGALAGHLKYTHGEHVVIDRTDNPGRVISFAQTDVVERLLSGADSRFIQKSEEYIHGAIVESAKGLSQLFARAGVDAKTAEALIDGVASGVSGGFGQTFAVTARAEFEDDFNQMVAMMPKQDIIELAEALVSITAIERKASSEQATVGGPVDVGFITRHEGFVWIKRKHYFNQSLNPRYFWRKFNLMGTWEVQNESVDRRAPK